jgi:acyl CoA:acetate/3-ketoacid CoA transferase beta subunit
MSDTVTAVRRADVCAIAIAETFRGDGEILVSPMGTLPSIGARLARLTFEPDILLSDGEAFLLADVPPLGAPLSQSVVEGWIPYRQVFDVVASGRRHVMMGASQIDPSGNQNISCIGDQAHPKSQLLGARGAPGNTVNNRTSYWVPRHSTRVFVPAVDMVSGVGYARAGGGGPRSRPLPPARPGRQRSRRAGLRRRPRRRREDAAGVSASRRHGG